MDRLTHNVSLHKMVGLPARGKTYLAKKSKSSVA